MSSIADQEHSLTFGQLNDMIDNWNLISMDLQRKYHDQKDLLNDLFARLVEHEYPLRDIHTRLNTINYYDELLQFEVNNIAHLNVELEKDIERMENIQRNVQGIYNNELTPDPCNRSIREIMYNQAEGIFKYITSLIENLDVLLPDNKQAAGEEYTEQIKESWMLTLNELEKLEQMIYKLQSAAQMVECKQRMFRHKFIKMCNI